MRMTYSRSADALMIHLDEGKARANGIELPGGAGFMDLAEDGSIVAIEILDASRHYAKSALDSLGEEELVLSLSQAAKLAGTTPQAMRKACERGRLAGQKVGRDWVVTSSALTEYLNSRWQRMPAQAG